MNMENMDSPASNSVGALQSKLQGFGRGGNSFQELRSKAQTNGFSNGGVRNGIKSASFGSPAANGDNDNWDDPHPKPRNQGFGGGGYKSGQSGFGTSKTEDDWNDGPPAASSTAGFGSRSGGFGTSNDRFGGGKGSSCYKCGEAGHMSRECPQGGSGGGGGNNRGCHKCGEDGHFARECPSGGNGGGGGGGNKGCFKCGGEGHFARECPNEGSGKGGSGGFGSTTDDPSRSKLGGGFGDQAESRGGGGGCRRCGEEGHFARECPNQGGGGGGGCHRCGEEGHFVRECPQPAAAGEKPRELYIPPEVDESQLFISNIRQGINFDKYDCIDVLVTGNNKTVPITAFEDAELQPTFLKNVKKSGYTKPTPIQKHAIPAVLAGRDLMGCAQTGSGKTAAFLLPVLTGMVNKGLQSTAFSLNKEPQTIVVAPTRELANQIYREALKFASGTSVQTVVVYGGTDRRHQKSRIERGANLVVGTPGRLLDFIGDGTIGLSKVQYLILDEADRMLDLGFEPDMRRLVEASGMPPKDQRQTLMFSATFREEIQRLAGDFLRGDYLFITVGVVGGACSDVTQAFVEVDQLQKRDVLCDILNNAGTQKVLVFVGQKRNADFLASYLSQSGYPTTSIHGDRLQREREEALRMFKVGSSSVLIATNVAARGLDIPEVAHVVNYDMPQDIDEYVHRIGRTGRCGNLGKATSFYNHSTDYGLLGGLLRILTEAHQDVPDWLADYASSQGLGGQEGGSRGRREGRFASKDIRPRGKLTSDNGMGGGAGGGAVNACGDDENWD